MRERNLRDDVRAELLRRLSDASAVQCAIAVAFVRVGSRAPFTSRDERDLAARLLLPGRHGKPSDRYAFAAAAVLAMGVGIEGFRLVRRAHLARLRTCPIANRIGVVHPAVFSDSGVRDRTPPAPSVREPRVDARRAEPIFMVAHAAITRVGGSLFGLSYIPLAAGVGFFMKRTLDRGERFSLPTRNPGGRVRGAEKGYRLIPRPRGYATSG